ncbi:DUF732 domain-containing protein [Nocardia sp. 2]|uniref:DUF732 domain-containing protein n=1 Tax=Nocardia acididurans TaxID=2802282 RepID=A0ABS1MCL7_9NOCA|nr:DUF732 domain-containing protein [Nocardia acididurans]MBL1078391.1 DUF732 domain-containing protein [Nocardia acididurans]
MAVAIAVMTAAHAGIGATGSHDAEFLAGVGVEPTSPWPHRDSGNGQRLIADGKRVCSRLREGVPVVATDRCGFERRLIAAAIAAYCPEFAGRQPNSR